MTYSLCFSRPRFSRQNDRLTADSWENPNFFGGHSFYYPKKICANELWSGYEVVMTYAMRSFIQFSKQKNPDVFSTAHLRWKWDIHVTVTMENIPWVTHFGAPASELTHFFLLPQIQEAIMPRPRWTTHISPWNHLTTSKTSVVYQPGKQGNYHKLYMPYIYIYVFFFGVYIYIHIYIYIYIFDKGLGCQWRVNVTLQMWSLVIPRGAGQASPTVSQDL